jgi:DnaJ-like protein
MARTEQGSRMRSTKFHGRVEDSHYCCSVRGCREPGEFRAPQTPSDFDGPGSWRWLCLEHVREHNAKYDFFEGMSTEEIEAAQSPIAGWDRATRAFALAGSDRGPAWADFADPLDAISARFRPEARRQAIDRFTAKERHALGVLGLKDDAGLHKVRKRYSELVRRYHPDRNGGDRSHEKKLGEVIEAWQLLKAAKAFA